MDQSPMMLGALALAAALAIFIGLTLVFASASLGLELGCRLAEFLADAAADARYRFDAWRFARSSRG